MNVVADGKRLDAAAREDAKKKKKKKKGSKHM